MLESYIKPRKTNLNNIDDCQEQGKIWHLILLANL